VIVTWATGGLSAVRRATWKNQLEAGVLAAGLFGVGILVFSTQQWAPDKTPSLLYWPLPFLVWATVRFGPRGVSTGLLLVYVSAIVGATHGQDLS
jgi:integral membrane sensor domain MASE1